MPTRPNPFDAAGATAPGADAAFAGLGAGLGFFQDWMKAASSVLPAMGQAASPASNAWALPTLDPEELDKRIQELKTVQFWLEQNGRMIGMTIQTLEVQRMTLQTLRGMNVPTDVLRASLKVPPQAPKAEPPSEPPASPPSNEADTAEAAVNPMAWWNTLTEQFSTLATQATAQAAQAAQAVQAAAKPAAAAASSAKPRAPRKRSASSSVNNTNSVKSGQATAAKGPARSSKNDKGDNTKR